MRRWLAVAPTVLIAVACSSGLPTVAVPSLSPAPSGTVISPVSGFAERSPSPSPEATPTPSPSPSPGGNAYGVLVDLLSSTQDYTISLVDAAGVVARQFVGGKRITMNTNHGRSVDLPYISTSLTSVYFLDTDSLLIRGRADGQRTRVMDLHVPSGSEAAFAVSPDDTRIAVSELDYTVYPVRVTLYTDSVGGGQKKVIYTSTSNYVWPVAWHGGLLVLAHAVGPYEEDITKDAPTRENPYSAISYHLVDPANANRKVLVGAACTVSGPLSPAGTGCIQGGAVDWTGNDVGPWSTTDWGQRSSAAALSPDGQWMAAADPNNPGHMAIWRRDGSIANYATSTGNLYNWAGWIDNENLIVGSYFDGTWQPTVENVIRGGYVYPIAAKGFYAARLPTDIS